MPQCREEMPPVTQLSETRWTRCYLYDEAQTSVAHKHTIPESIAH
jgi:hypothetical protein